MTKLNKTLMATTAIVFASGLAMPAAAQDAMAAPGVVKSGKKMKLKLYGQITRAFGIIDDGSNTTFIQGRNQNTSTRMGIDGRGKVTKNVSLRTRMEFEIRNGDMNQLTGQGGDGAGLRIRHLDAIFSHKRLGAVWIGRGDTPANGTSEKNLLPGGSSGRLGGGSVSLLNSSKILDNLGGVVGSVSDFFNSMDGVSRRQRIRYDTPTFGGLKVGVSVIDQQSYDVGLHYSGKIGGIKVKVGGAFVHIEGGLLDEGDFPNANSIEQFNGSVSVLAPMGIGATLAGGVQDIDFAPGTDPADQRDPTNFSIGVFYTGKWTELGPTGIEYNFQQSDEILERDDEGTAHSIQLVQVLANTGTDTFVTLRFIDVERVGEAPEDLWFIGAGFRARF